MLLSRAATLSSSVARGEFPSSSSKTLLHSQQGLQASHRYGKFALMYFKQLLVLVVPKVTFSELLTVRKTNFLTTLDGSNHETL